jgi:hypothetical protein
MSIANVLHNSPLIAALLAWTIAQTIKLPIEFFRKGQWNWSLLFTAGGMPSSHSALVTAVAHAIGLTQGFGSGVYALAIVVAMVVIYDATGIRRQAGRHAEIINAMVQDMVEGHPLKEEQLRVVLGHSPLEAFVGLLLGLGVAQLTIALWPA